MREGPRIAIDAMGGDGGLATMLAGAAIALSADPGLRFRIVGDEALLRPELARRPAMAAASEVIHAPETVSGEDRPSQAIRRANRTSMGLAIAAVKTTFGSTAPWKRV